jgi:class I fructose-bisphosphate aldolase/fructose-bisphosphate aldolase/2-amino-3,7-dideoxy-D-threo-hept-6-ulosonate synthase
MSGTGKRLRWSRFLDGPTGRSLIVPVDHGLTMGPIDGLRSAREVAGWLSNRSINGIIVHKGLLERLVAAEGLKPMGVMLHLNGMTMLAAQPDTKEMLTSVEAAVRLGADAVSVQVNFTEQNAAHNLGVLGSVVDAALAWGLPVLAMVYDKVASTSSDQQVARMRHLIRSAYELGVDAVKIDAPSSLADIPALLADISDDVSVFFAGGPLTDLSRLVEVAALAVSNGAVGLCVGRNVFQRPDRANALRLLHEALVHRRADGVPLSYRTEGAVNA